MDRTSIIAVIVCVLIYFVMLTEFNRLYPPAHLPPAKATTAQGTSTNAAPGNPSSPATTTTTSSSVSKPALTASTEPAAISALPEKLNFLENDELKVTFTTHGASIKQIELKKHHEGHNGDTVVLNEDSHNDVMALAGWPGAAFNVQGAPTSLTYTTTLPDGVIWTRTYTIGTDCLLTVKDALANSGTAEAMLPGYSIALGRAEPLLVHGHYQTISNQYLGAGWLTTSQFHLTTVSDFNPSGFISRQPGRDMFTSKSPDNKMHIFSSQDFNPLRWLAVENQFFTVLLTPDPHHPMSEATFQTFNTRDNDGKIPFADEPNIEAFANFPGLSIPAGQTIALDYKLFTGPKEYSTLNQLGDNQGELMNYNGFLPFALLIVPMLDVLHWFNGLVHSYGLAIILLTLVIKIVTWPLQSKANRSGKRMQALAPKIKELQAKYKDQPDKIGAETMSLYRDYGVNPVGGCLPAFVQMPVFFSLYYMLQNAVELRGQHFLWVKDLTQPDTVFSAALPFTIPLLNISHLVVNPLPIAVTALMAVMMRMTPQIGDPQQQKVAQFMPLFFLFLFYNFAAALSLYYVINNAVSIIQIYRNLKKPLPELKRKPKKA